MLSLIPIFSKANYKTNIKNKIKKKEKKYNKIKKIKLF